MSDWRPDLVKALYFGVWEGFGHFWHISGGWRSKPADLVGVPFEKWIDGGYAPRRFKDGCYAYRRFVKDPDCCFVMEAPDDDTRRHIYTSDSTEYAQGEFLIHKKNGWTLMSWWDRTHGDHRGACNSSIVAEGDFEDHQMFDLLATQFSKIVDDLAKASVVLKNVTPRSI